MGSSRSNRSRCLERLEQLERLGHEEPAKYWKEDALNELAVSLAEARRVLNGPVEKSLFLYSWLSLNPGTGPSDACLKRTGAAGAAPDQNPTPTRFRV
jgi:hypothetical protein